jgi:flavin-dependent dehydrogenase
MVEGPLPRLTVDFNYGGRSESGEGVTMLNPKSGDRSGLSPHLRAELEAAGYQAEEGMTVRLVDRRADVNDDGRVCDMEVDARITIQPDGAWTAVWPWDAMEWIPS